MRQNSYQKLIAKYSRGLLQSVSGIAKCEEVYYKVRQILKSVIDCFDISPPGITKCDRLLLQSTSGITKCGSYYKVKRNIRDYY